MVCGCDANILNVVNIENVYWDGNILYMNHPNQTLVNPFGKSQQSHRMLSHHSYRYPLFNQIMENIRVFHDMDRYSNIKFGSRPIRVERVYFKSKYFMCEYLDILSGFRYNQANGCKISCHLTSHNNMINECRSKIYDFINYLQYGIIPKVYYKIVNIPSSVALDNQQIGPVGKLITITKAQIQGHCYVISTIVNLTVVFMAVDSNEFTNRSKYVVVGIMQVDPNGRSFVWNVPESISQHYNITTIRPHCMETNSVLAYSI